MTRTLAALLLTASTALPASRAHAEDPPMLVLTDTEDYCNQLQHRVQEHTAWSAEVKRLYAEGRQMCDHGDVRAGISRLRQALRILNHHIPVP